MDQKAEKKLQEFCHKLDQDFRTYGGIDRESVEYGRKVAECLALGIKPSQISSVENHVVNLHYMKDAFRYYIPEDIVTIISTKSATH